jgi:hypothetical protein
MSQIRPLLALLLLLICAPPRLVAQYRSGEPLRYGRLTLGRSEVKDVASELGETLSCSATATGRDGTTQLQRCTAANAGSWAQPEAVFRNGRLFSLRLFLPRDVNVHAALSVLEKEYGTVARLDPNGLRSGGLRFWEFTVAPHRLLLYESRNRETGQIRIRLQMTAGD